MLDELFFNLAELDDEGDELDCNWLLHHSWIEEWDIFIEGVDDEHESLKTQGKPQAGLESRGA